MTAYKKSGWCLHPQYEQDREPVAVDYVGANWPVNLTRDFNGVQYYVRVFRTSDRYNGPPVVAFGRRDVVNGQPCSRFMPLNVVDVPDDAREDLLREVNAFMVDALARRGVHV